jgi:hypothetical protein
VALEDESVNIDGLVFKSYNPFANLDFVRDIWLGLLPNSPHSYFTSWGWISTWLNSLPQGYAVEFISAFLNERPVIAFFVCRRTSRRYGFLRSRTVSLNSTGDRYYDELYIEYNSILYDPAAASRLNHIINYLDMTGWDEIRLPGISAEFASDLKLLNSTGVAAGAGVLFDESMHSFFVDLQKVRDAGMDFLKLLSANKRSQIRRSIKQYELDGRIMLHEAQTREEALAMLDQLAVLHQLEWTSLGKSGAFSNQYLYHFHRDLIGRRFDEKEIQLLHIYNEKMTIGYLYCFVYEGRVLFYQCGFNYLADNNYRPGLVSHYFAVLHNAAGGKSVYDFLGGDSAYKSSLSTDSTSIYWVRLIRNGNRLILERLVVALKKKVRVLRTKIQTKFK